MSVRKGNILISGKGLNGTNGVSPTATVNKVGDTTVFTVTDINGTTTTQIFDGEKVQYSTLPTASVDNLGKIVQYVGETDSAYTNGYFYIGTTDGESTPTYSWENINVQASGDSFGFITNVIADSATASNLNIVNYLNGAGVYKFFAESSMEITGLNGGNGTKHYSYHVYGNTFYMIKDYATVNNGDYLGFCFTSDDNDSTNIGMLFTTIWKAKNGNGVFYSRDNNIKLDLVLKYGNQIINGVKTFNALPESPVVPTTANQLTNKSYVDSKAIQYSTMPTADSTNEGKIVQYIGATDSTYTNGYFYKAVSDSESTPTYSWENIQVQESGSGSDKLKSNGNVYVLDLTGNYYSIYSSGSTNLTNDDKTAYIACVNQILNSDTEDNYIIINLVNSDISRNSCLYKITKTELLSLINSNSALQITFMGDNRHMSNMYGGKIIIWLVSVYFNKNYYDAVTNTISSLSSDSTSNRVTRTYIFFGASQNYMSYGDTIYLPTRDNVLIKTNTTAFTPTGDYNPATKKYVDDTILLKTYQLAGLSEYSASSTYAVGDYVYYDSLIYKCNTTISVAEAWDSTHWTQKTYMDYLAEKVVQ